MIDGAVVEVEGRPALRFARPLPHSAERVWRAITDPAELAQWFVAPVEWKPELGETWDAMGHAGEITALDEPRLLAWTWGIERYSFEIVAAGDGCLLVFTHVFNPEYGPPAQHAAGWQTYFARLDVHLGGDFLSEADAHQPFDALHAQYRDRFASELPVSRVGKELRLERRFAHSVERVGRAITDPAELANWFPQEEPMEVTESEEPRVLAGTWFGDKMRFELVPDGAGCLLSFTQEFDDPKTSARTAAGWDRCFARFDALLAGEPLGLTESLRDWPAVHERYASAFGVDPALGRTAWIGHPAT
ncbi:hypothetical protein BH10ACT11_BH10ACT11_18110 [soil metagenome]